MTETKPRIEIIIQGLQKQKMYKGTDCKKKSTIKNELLNLHFHNSMKFVWFVLVLVRIYEIPVTTLPAKTVLENVTSL